MFFAAIAMPLSAVAQGTNRLGWSPEQAQAWQAMYADNHQYWQDLLAKADNPNVYADEGLYDGLCYLITGDAAYAQRAWAHNSHWRGRTFNPQGDLPANSNVTRARFSQLSLLYSWVADGLDPADKADFRDVLDFWTDMVTGQGPINWGMTSMNDSDEVIGNYFGVVLYALAIADEDPSRSEEILNYCGDAGCCNQPYDTMCIGGLDATGIDRSTWRNTIAEYATNSLPGGLWMESTAYNNSTVRYLVQGVTAVNEYFGQDKFPEVTAHFNEIADVLIERSAPDFSEPFQWGDMDEQHLHNFSLFHGLGMYGYVYHATHDPYVAERYLAFYEQYRPSTGNGSMFINLDPNATQQSRQGYTSHDASGRGVAYWHAGWASDDSFFASTMFNPINVHHERASMANFNLWRQGGWAIVNPKGYLPTRLEMPYLNTLMIYGGIGRCREAWGRFGFQADPRFLYHIGGTGGQFADAGSWMPPPESIHEWTRTHMLLHHADGSDSIIVFDRLDTCGPLIGPNACITPEHYSSYRTEVRNLIDAAQGKHQWIIHTPTDAINVNGDEFSWTAPNGETVRLTTFMDNYSFAVYDELAAYQTGGGPLYLRGWLVDDELKYQLRLVPDATDEWMTMLNVIHVGSDASVARLTSSGSLDTADGVLIETGGERQGLVLNATRAVTPPPTPNVGSHAAHDPQRHAKNARLHFFKRGFHLTIPAGPQTLLRLADLDPALLWTVDLDGTGAQPLAVSDQGLAEIMLESSTTPMTLSITTPGYCQADITGDGVLDASDFSAWVQAYNTGDPIADQNHDAQLTPADFTAWIANFNAGCS
ncbi:MAG TPA: hypothetical protein ENJ00_02360 [Phycisphaerales bacterium]|nr:hypothetical protein [Phycisphaerales bacterium]